MTSSGSTERALGEEPPGATSLFWELFREGGIRIDTKDASGAVAIRTLLQADGNMIVVVREDCLSEDQLVDRHFHVLARRVELVVGLARRLDRHFFAVQWASRALVFVSLVASAGTAAIAILRGEWPPRETWEWAALGAVGWAVRRIPSRWMVEQVLGKTAGTAPG